MSEKSEFVVRQFEYKNITFLVDRVSGIWAPTEADENFPRIYAEAVIRLDMHDNDLQFQLTENGALMAVACGSKKGDGIRNESWWAEQHEKMTENQKFSFKLSRDYLSSMDESTYALMSDDDVKLDLFISVKKGYGQKVLEAAISCFKKRGYKNIFLWTDCECNVGWYFDHGYELVHKGIYEPFSSEEKKYETYVLKKEII